MIEMVFRVMAVALTLLVAMMALSTLSAGPMGAMALRMLASARRGETMNGLRRFLGLEDDAPAQPPTPPARVAVMTDPQMEGIPNDARPHVAEINRLIGCVMPRLSTEALMATVLIEVEQLRDVHLPKLCRSYAAIAPDARREIYQRTGKSASVHLIDSLGAMERRLRTITTDLAREDIDAFTDNARFVTHKYGDPDNPFS